MFTKTKLALLVSAACMTLPTAIQAAESNVEPAQTKDAKKVNKVERIMVTASRRSTSLAEVPYNISALDSNYLDKAGITDFTKLTRNIPGLVFSDTGPRSNGISNGLIMRGMNAQPVGSEDSYRSSSPAVSVYVGETPLFVNLNMRDINRVEVLRGPQGTLYGSGSLGGTLRYIQNQASTEGLEGHVAAKMSQTDGAGDFNTDTEFMVNVPLSDTFAVRFVGAYLDNSGFIDAHSLERLDADNQPTGEVYSAKDINDNQLGYARFAASWEASDDVSVNFNYQQQSDDVGGRQAYAKSVGMFQTGIKQSEPLTSDVQIAALDIEVDLGFASFTSSSSVYKNEADGVSDISHDYPSESFWAYYEGIPREIVTSTRHYQTDAFVQELRLVSEGAESIDWVVGAYYSSWHGASGQYDAIIGVDDFFGITNPQARDLNYSNVQKDSFSDAAIFGELTYRVSDDWQMTFGARFFEQEFESYQRTTLPTCGVFCGEGELGLSEASAIEKVSDQIFKFNTSYDLSDDMMVYMTLSEGFRHGGANGLPIDDAGTDAIEGGVYANHASLRTFAPDKATNFEVGVKGFAFDELIEYTVAAFSIDWDDNQVLQRSPVGGFPIVYNLGASKSQGLELESKFHFTSDLKLSLGYTYVSAKTSSNTAGLPDLDGNPTLFIEKDSDLPGVPNHSVTAALDYSFVVADEYEMSYRLGGFYKGGFNTDFNEGALNYDEVASQTIFDTTLSMYVDQWQVSLFVNNLFNSTDSSLELGNRPYTSYSGQPDAQKRLQNGDLSYVVRPRTIGLSVKYSFDM